MKKGFCATASDYTIICVQTRYSDHARIQGGAKGALAPPPPPHKILLPQIVRRGPRGPWPPPRGPRGPWPPPLQNPGSAYEWLTNGHRCIRKLISFCLGALGLGRHADDSLVTSRKLPHLLPLLLKWDARLVAYCYILKRQRAAHVTYVMLFMSPSIESATFLARSVFWKNHFYFCKLRCRS